MLSELNSNIDISDEISITKTSGNSTVSSIKAKKYGKIVELYVYFTLTASTSSGSNIFVGALNSYIPVIGANGSGYALSAGLGGYITTEGVFTLRALGSVGSSGTVGVSFTYIVD